MVGGPVLATCLSSKLSMGQETRVLEELSSTPI